MVRSVVNGSTVVHPSCPSALRAVHTTARLQGALWLLGGGPGEGRSSSFTLTEGKTGGVGTQERLDGVRCAHSSVRALDLHRASSPFPPPTPALRRASVWGFRAN